MGKSIPKSRSRRLTLHYLLPSTNQFKAEEQETESEVRCFNRRLHEIELGSKSLRKDQSEKESLDQKVSASILLKGKEKLKRRENIP